MRPLKTIIVDDQTGDLSRLRKLLETRPDIFDVAEEATNYHSAISIFSKQVFDLSILDNDLNGYDFRDILREVSPNRLGIIAVTSIKAADLLDKIVTMRNIILFPKPHVMQTIDRFILRLEQEIVDKEKNRYSKFIIKTNKGTYNIPCSDICFIKTKEDGNGVITEFFCDGDTQRKLQEAKRVTSIVAIENWESLKDVEKQIDEKIFFRSADNYIINLTKVTGSKLIAPKRLISFNQDGSTGCGLVAVASKMGREFLERNYYVK